MGIVRPVIIIGAPRSGTTLLFSMLSSSPELWSLYSESEGIIGRWFHPARVGWDRGNRLVPADLDDEVGAEIRAEFYQRALNEQRWFPAHASRIYSGNRKIEMIRRRAKRVLFKLMKPRQIRLVEKTPKNSLRVGFMGRLFPDARFVHLVRDVRANVGSLIEGWKSGRYQTYRLPVPLNLVDWQSERWSFALPPGWNEYVTERFLAQVCAFQYKACNEAAMTDLGALPKDRVFRVRYEDLIADRIAVGKQLANFVEIEYEGGFRRVVEQLPVVNSVSAPSSEKWKKNARVIEAAVSDLGSLAERLGYR